MHMGGGEGKTIIKVTILFIIYKTYLQTKCVHVLGGDYPSSSQVLPFLLQVALTFTQGLEFAVHYLLHRNFRIFTFWHIVNFADVPSYIKSAPSPEIFNFCFFQYSATPVYNLYIHTTCQKYGISIAIYTTPCQPVSTSQWFCGRQCTQYTLLQTNKSLPVEPNMHVVSQSYNWKKFV